MRARIDQRVQVLAAGVLMLHTGFAAAQSSTLVINEIDYDQIGTDAAEFVELLNVGCAPIDLDPYELRLINGNDNTVYATINLPGAILAPGDYFVVCGNPATTTLCDLDVLPDTNLIQNGAPDAVALFYVPTRTLIDTVSYEGDVPGYTETAGAAADSNVTQGSIGRAPNGVDTNHNFNDFQFQPTISPGQPNVRFLVGSCTGDVNGDGTVDVNDLLAVVGAWGPCADPGNCAPDISPPCGDDVVNVNDLLAVVGTWGPCG